MNVVIAGLSNTYTHYITRTRGGGSLVPLLLILLVGGDVVGVGVGQSGYHNIHLLALNTSGFGHGLTQPSPRHSGELPRHGDHGEVAYPEYLGVHAGGVPGEGEPVLPCIQQYWLGCVASLCLGAGILQKTRDEVPERIASHSSLGEVKLTRTISGPSCKAVPQGWLAGGHHGAVVEGDLVAGHVHPLVDELHGA